MYPKTSTFCLSECENFLLLLSILQSASDIYTFQPPRSDDLLVFASKSNLLSQKANGFYLLTSLWWLTLITFTLLPPPNLKLVPPGRILPAFSFTLQRFYKHIFPCISCNSSIPNTPWPINIDKEVSRLTIDFKKEPKEVVLGDENILTEYIMIVLLPYKEL